MCQWKLWVLCVFSVCSVRTFNIDFVNYASYDGANSSMFGFSVAVHREGNNGWVLVGAPEAQSSYQRTVHRGGAVYKCPTDRDGSCQEIPFDTKGDIYDSNGQQMDNKNEQWFGATLSSAGRENGPIVACAPRYTWYPRRKTRRDPVGTCYVSNGLFSHFNEYSPCRTYQWGYHRQGSCQAGFSAAINSVGDRLFIGSPGSWYWQGQMYSIDAQATFEFKPLLFSATYGHEGQVHQQSLETRPAVFSTASGTEKDDDSYMGYSTIVGDFLGNGEEGIAVGMPRGNYLRGKVLLFTWNLTNFLQHFTSDQIGSYYGYALAASDVDGDQKLDLIIGAPMYTVQDNKDKYDVGRVYVIRHDTLKGKFIETLIIDGYNSKSRFGQALASLGDINQDGYGDFAVGAPYDGENNGGAVYIYLGSSTGARKKYSQVIFAEEIISGPTGSLTTFGFSITGGLDLDNNEYPDVAVGAYLSGKAFFFRSRPVIRVDGYVEFLAKGKEVDITNPNYELKTYNGTKAVRTQIQFCCRYYGKGIPESLTLGLEYILDSKKLIDPRMGFVDAEGQNIKNATITLYKDVKITCLDPIDVYVKCDIRDKLTALVAEVTYRMKDEGYVEQQRNPRSVLTPVLDLHSPPSKKDSLSIHKNCGDDNVCIPNLNLTVTPSVRDFLLDSREKLYLEISIANTGEDAFESTIEVKYPESLYYSGTQDVAVVSRVLCSSVQNDTVIKCEVGNPIPMDKIVIFRILWEPNYDKITPRYDFVVTVNSTNQEIPKNRADNTQKISVGILRDFNQELHGRSIPKEVFFSSTSSLYTADISNQTKYTFRGERLSEEVIGPQVTHVYHLKNEGKTTIQGTELFFVWPATTHPGENGNLPVEDFFYLLEPPHFSMTENLNIQCGPIPANYRNFELLKSDKTIWERLNIDIQAENITASPQIGVIKGGQTVTSDEKTDKQVAESGDSSRVISERRNKTEGEVRTLPEYNTKTTVQVFQGGEEVARKLGWESYRSRKINGKNYIYRCFRNGRESDCGSIINVLGSDFNWLQQGGCLEPDQNGKWKGADCGKLGITTVTGKFQQNQTTTGVGRKKSEITIQIFQGGDEIAGNYKRERINGQDFIYRCFRRGEEVECGENVSLVGTNIDWLGLQQEGNIRYQCLERDSTGKLKKGDCGKLPITPTFGQWSGTSIQLVQADDAVVRQFGNYRRTKINNQDFIYRCFKRGEEVDCGDNLSFTGHNIKQLHQEGNVRFQCLETDTRGNLRQGDCARVPKIQVGNLGLRSDTSIQFFLANDDVMRQLEGKNYRRTRINNLDFIYRCFRSVGSTEEEVDCGDNLSFSGGNTAWLLQQLNLHHEGNVQYQCLESDEQGNLKQGDCGRLPKIQLDTGSTETRIQFFLANDDVIRQLSGKNYRRERINNQDFIFRCFRRVEGKEEEVKCGDNIVSGGNAARLLQQLRQDGSLHYQCLERDSSGNLKKGDCGAQLPKIRSSATTVQFFQLNDDLARQLGNKNYRRQRINNQNFVYRCFRRVDGREEEVDCGDSFSGSNVAWLLQQLRLEQDGNVRYQCLESDSTGNLRQGDCERLPKLPVLTTSSTNRWQYNSTHYRNASGVFRLDSSQGFLARGVYTIQIFQGGEAVARQIGSGSYSNERVGSKEYVYRCFNTNEEQVDCGPAFSLTRADIMWLLERVVFQQEDQIRYVCVVQDPSRRWRNVDCGRLPTIQRAPAGTKTITTNLDIVRRCHKLVDNEWQLVDCNSDVRFQTGTADRTLVQECFKTAVNGARERIPCEQVSQIQGGAKTGGIYEQYGQPQPQYPQNNYDVYGEDIEEDDYDASETPQTRRDPKTYGTHSVDALGLGGGAYGSGLSTTVLDVTGNSDGAHGGGYHQTGETHWSETRQIPPAYNDIGRDNVPTEFPRNRRWRARPKRQVLDDHPSLTKIRKDYPCKTVGCIYMRCTIDNLEHNKQLYIALRGRINARVLRNMGLAESLSFSSLMLARVNKLPHLGVTTTEKLESYELKTTVKKSEGELKTDIVPLWVVVLSAVAGTIILLLVVFLLYKCGFFKRNRPSSAPERQPLNRNGYHHGDEAL